MGNDLGGKLADRALKPAIFGTLAALAITLSPWDRRSPAEPRQ